MSESNQHIPEEISCDSQVFDLAYHPHANFIAIGEVSGKISIFKLSESDDDENLLLFDNHKHKQSCRGLLFTQDGQSLYSISSDKSILSIDANGKRKFHLKKAHDDAINKIIALNESNIFATGDDSGIIKVWDARTSMNEVMKWSLHEDYISGLTYHEASNTLISVGGDATLCTYDLRNTSESFRSDDQEDELHCVEHLKNGKKVVCGTQEGVLLIFSWGKCK